MAWPELTTVKQNSETYQSLPFPQHRTYAKSLELPALNGAEGDPKRESLRYAEKARAGDKVATSLITYPRHSFRVHAIRLMKVCLT